MNPGTFVVKSANECSRTITSRKGQQLTFREQQAALFTGGDFPVPCKIPLDDNQQPYQPGQYVIDPACLLVGDFDRAGIGRLKLLPAPAPASK